MSVEEQVSYRHHMWIGKMSESEPYDEASKGNLLVSKAFLDL